MIPGKGPLRGLKRFPKINFIPGLEGLIGGILEHMQILRGHVTLGEQKEFLAGGRLDGHVNDTLKRLKPSYSHRAAKRQRLSVGYS